MAFNRAENLQELHDEIENDPQSVGYKDTGVWKGDQAIADLLNDPANGGTIQREIITPQEIIEQITIADWEAISASHRLYIQLLPSLASVSAVQNGTEVRSNLLAIFGASTTTRANLIAVVEKQGSRAEVLWGEGSRITAADVGYAANL